MQTTPRHHVLINRLLDQMPKLHLWDGKFTLGGFDRAAVASLYWELVPKVPAEPVIVETGAGLSTLAFLAAKPKQLVTVSVDPDGGLEQRLRDWAVTNELPIERLEYINGYSELHLPGVAARGLQADICMIDGGHGWPTVFVDFCYMNMCLKQGGFLVIDDVHLYSVAQLLQLLKKQPGWTVCHKVTAKTVILRKDNQRSLMPDFSEQPFVMNNS